MRTLSIRQPYAWLIVNGLKKIENRTWKTKFRGEILIHTGKQLAHGSSWEKIRRIMGSNAVTHLLNKSEYTMGGIVGKVEIVDCVQESNDKWFEGPNGFVLRKAEKLPFHPCGGKLSFFDVDLKPKTCGECKRFYKNPDQSGHDLCTPIKDKYGWEPVTEDQEPNINCPYEDLYLDNILDINMVPKS